MNRNRENQKCPKTNCWGKIVEKEVYHDVSPFDAYNETTYSISVCNNSDCGIGKAALEELEYWKELSDELEVPDLKYWQMSYSRSDKCFWVTVRDIQEDGVLVGTPKHVWKESISPETLAKNLVSVGDSRFRDLITKSLKLMATEIKKTRQK
jgi:hypothetical protein